MSEKCGCKESGRPGCNYEWETFVDDSACLYPALKRRVDAARVDVQELVEISTDALCFICDQSDYGNLADRLNNMIVKVREALAALDAPLT